MQKSLQADKSKAVTARDGVYERAAEFQPGWTIGAMNKAWVPAGSYRERMMDHCGCV